MPQFGKPAAQRQAERARRASNSTFLRNFRDPETMLRWLWEDPARVWVTFYYHFHWAKKISYPCVRNSFNDEGTKIVYCLGCTWPADESLDEEARKKDGDWRVRNSNYGIAAPALTLKTIDGEDKEYLDIYQLGVGLHTDIATLYRENGTVTARDMKIIRTDAEGSKTKYTPVEKGDAAPRKYVVELRELLRECAPGMSAEEGTPAYEAGWARWRAGNAELGIPDINAILVRKYAEAAEAYGVSADEIADRNAAMLADTTASLGDLKAKAHAAKASAGVGAPDEAQANVTTPAAPAAKVSVEDLPLDELDMPVKAYSTLTELGIRTVGMLTAWSADTLTTDGGLEERFLTPIRMALAAHGLSLADDPGSEDTPAPAATPAAAELPAQAAAAVDTAVTHTNGAAAVAADGEPNFGAWDTPDIRDYLKEHSIEFPDKAPRSVLVGLANRHAIGF